MLSVSKCGADRSVAFGANPKFVGKFSKETKESLRNIPAIKKFRGDITFTLKDSLNKNPIIPSKYKRIQMNATIGNRGRLLEAQTAFYTNDSALVNKFVKTYNDTLGAILSDLSRWTKK